MTAESPGRRFSTIFAVCGRPVLNNPKGQNEQEPRDLVRRPVVASGAAMDVVTGLASRRNQRGGAGVVDAFTRDTGDLGIDDEDVWLPAADPHRPGAA